jgi:hypothetical protein
LIASAAVTSFAMHKSTWQLTNSPGRTFATPAWAARIFSVIVMPITTTPRRKGSLHGVLDRTPFAFQRFAGFAVWQQILSPHFALC